MYTAYHMIGLDKRDKGRLASPNAREAIEEITQKAFARYQAIRQSGVLRPSSIQEQLPRPEGNFFLEDHLARDNQYVFLSIGKRYWSEPDQLNFGFLFDAEKLLKQGAILRRYDLLSDYEDVLSDLVAARTGFREPPEWSEEETRMLMEALDNPKAHPGYKAPNNAYYDLMDAVQELRYDIPGVQEILAQFRVEVAELHEQVQLSGQEAIDFIRQNGETGQCELLVKGQLSLEQAIGRVEYGTIHS